jgi:hypothetical protein
VTTDDRAPITVFECRINTVYTASGGRSQSIRGASANRSADAPRTYDGRSADECRRGVAESSLLCKVVARSSRGRRCGRLRSRKTPLRSVLRSHPSPLLRSTVISSIVAPAPTFRTVPFVRFHGKRSRNVVKTLIISAYGAGKTYVRFAQNIRTKLRDCPYVLSKTYVCFWRFVLTMEFRPTDRLK